MSEQLQPSRVKHTLFLALSTMFVALGAFLIREHPVVGWLNIAFFGLGMVIFALNLVPGWSFLELRPEGFTVRSLYRSSRIEWEDVEEFFVARIGGRKMVCWNYSAGYGGQHHGRAFSRGVAGVEAAPPDTYGRTAEELARLLNERRLGSGTRPNNSSKPTPLRGAA